MNVLVSWLHPRRIVSGGQTGVDRGALEAAIAMGIAHGGWCPRGRLAEDGTVPSRYELDEHESADYAVRTLQNVIDSDATLILYEGRLQGGTLLTQRCAKREGKPVLAIRIGDVSAVKKSSEWLNQHQPSVLNVAGPRESNCPGIQQRSQEVLLAILAGTDSAVHRTDWANQDSQT